MIWTTWRQFRVPALGGVVALALFAAYVGHLGLDVRTAHDTYRARCAGAPDCPGLRQLAVDYENTSLYLAALLGPVPGLLGMFWGAPLVARELEAGTQRLVWNQSVTRRRWLAVKLAVVGLTAMAVTGAAAALVTWAMSPVDRIADNRFSTVLFGARNLAPSAYAALAVALGVLIGLVVRRTVPAMALTALAFVVLQILVPNLVRPHLLPPRHVTLEMTAPAINQARGLGSITGAPVVRGLAVPDAWVTDVSELRTRAGEPLDRAVFDRCFTDPPRTGAAEGPFGDTATCLADHDLHVDVAYQPVGRYWAFQWLESGLYLLLAALLAAVAFRRVRRHPS
ncbi:ABC transporter permease subunit [Micromonospora sp. WMMD980]|uniref:ABC transporter permease subunit n=1 Tax=Micromonospora sp. WMMD980 TaxID=3016088 RepID=UPI0024175956|nr:ABC transporter permease subunit [Micromonospora sp. WMMD980]MDG4800292.1 ABC transporter permease subunit [Micromonospora sp. WMMD980]